MEYIDAADVSWDVAGSSFEVRSLVVYAERRVRDWRWLWLRKRTLTRIVRISD